MGKARYVKILPLLKIRITLLRIGITLLKIRIKMPI